MTTVANNFVEARDECYRCGYDLRGIANSQPCPECGLLAERSRHVTDELHNTRPKWLRKIALGGVLIVLAVPVGLAAIPLVDFTVPQSMGGSAIHYCLLNWGPPIVTAFVLFVGVRLLTVPENYAPADEADARLRAWLRLLALFPLGLLLCLSGWTFLFGDAAAAQNPDLSTILIGTICALPLPLLIMLRLRGLAKRARSAHLAEHCVIVGIGASASVAYLGVVWILTQNWQRWFGQQMPIFSDNYCVMLMLFLIAAGLFLLWIAYLTIRFALAFWKAARELRRKWRVDDRSQVAVN